MGARPSADPQGALGAALPQRHRQSSCLTFLDPDSRVGLAGCRRCPWERSNRDSVGPTRLPDGLSPRGSLRSVRATGSVSRPQGHG